MYSYSPWEQSTKIQPRSQTVEWQHTWSAVEVQLHHQRWQRFVFGRFKWKVCFDRTVVCAACRNDIGWHWWWSSADATRWLDSEIADKEFKHIGVKLEYKKELKKGWSRKSIKIYCCNKDNINEWKMEYSLNLFLDFCHFSISDANLLLNSISLSRAMDIGYIPLYEKVSLDYCVEH